MAISDYIITPTARLAFPALVEPRMNARGKAKYEATLLFPKTSDISALRALIRQVVEAEWPDPSKRPGGLKLGLRDGDKPNGNGNIPNGYAGHWVFSATSNYKPGLFDANAKPVMDGSIFYPGCYVVAHVNAYTFKESGNSGASLGLANIQFVRDGERLGGGAPAPSFAPVPGSAAGAPAGGNGKAGGDSLDDLLG